MLKPTDIEYLKELKDRLYADGFSWHHDDYFRLMSILPEILEPYIEEKAVKPAKGGKDG